MDHSTTQASSSCDGCEMMCDDLLFRILLWLPVASLLRFKSVCKSWLSHITSSPFISQHTHRLSGLQEDDHKLIIGYIPTTCGRYFHFMFDFISVDNLQLSKCIELSPTDALHDCLWVHSGRLIASCDGVICLQHKRRTLLKDRQADIDVISLWNPATMQFAILPPPESESKENSRQLLDYGFGFDVKTDDYKVVRVFAEDTSSYPLNSQAEVYSLRTDSWSVIDSGPASNLYFCSNPRKPFKNGIYCWIASEWNSNLNRRLSVVSFDFSKDMFGVIPMPDIFVLPHRFIPDLSFLNGKVACIYGTLDDPAVHRDVWVLNEYGVKESWTKLYTITLGEFDKTIGFSMNGKIIFIQRTSEAKPCLYDPLTQEVSELPSQGTGITITPEASTYRESLVSVKSVSGVTRRAVYEDLKSINLEGRILVTCDLPSWLTNPSCEA